MVTTAIKPAASAETPAVQKNLNAQWLLAWGTIALCAWIGMAEVDKLVTASVVEGQGVDITSISSPFSNVKTILPEILTIADIERFVSGHVIFDLLYIIGYTALFLTANRTLNVFAHFGGNLLIYALALADITEDVIILFAVNGASSDGSYWLPIVIVRSIKWILALTVVIGIGFGLVRYSGEKLPANPPIVGTQTASTRADDTDNSGRAEGADVEDADVEDADVEDADVEDADLEDSVVETRVPDGSPVTRSTDADTGKIAKKAPEPGGLRAWLKKSHLRISEYQQAKAVGSSNPADSIPASLVSRRALWGIGWKMQRFSAVVVLLVAVLMIAPPGPDFLNQVPDIIRGLILELPSSLDQLVISLICFAALYFAVFQLSILRVERAQLGYGSVWSRPSGPDWLPWVVAAGALLAVGGLFAWWNTLGTVDWTGLLVVVAVLLLIPVVSLCLVNVPDPTISEERHRQRHIEAAPRVVRAVGIGLTRALACLLFVGVVRSTVAPIVVGVDGVAMALCGFVALVLGSMVWLLKPTQWRALPSRPDQHSVSQHFWSRIGLLAGAAVVGLVIIAIPVKAARLTGPLGMIFLGLGILTAVLFVIAWLVQTFRPSRIFRILGLEVTPAISLILIIGVLVPTFSDSDAFHRARSATPEAGTDWAKYGTTTAFEDWKSRIEWEHCSLKVPPGMNQPSTVNVMPMIMVAAEGGGARAAWWTANAMETLLNTGAQVPGVPEKRYDKCGANTVFLTSGASGGSIGLAVVRSSTKGDLHPNLVKIVEPTALSAASDGLLVRDMLAGFTGLLPGAVDAPEGAETPDRAALMEGAWIADVPDLDKAFVAPVSGKAKEPEGLVGTADAGWRTVFNTTSALTGCKVIISDFTTEPDATDPDGLTDPDSSGTGCGLGGDPYAGSSNLYSTNPCYIGMPVITAALMSGRFGVVTPSGVVGVDGENCGTRDQLIDGGYAENSGVATINSVAGDVMPAVRAHNASYLANPDPSSGLIVPVVLSLENSPRPPNSDAPKVKPQLEPIVPISGLTAKGSRLISTDSLLEGFRASTSDWLACTDSNAEKCEPLKLAGANAVPDRVVVASPPRAAQIAPPLGWVLSPASKASLDQGLTSISTCDDCPFGSLLKSLKGS